MNIVTRIAPSPTGYFHIGTARTALFNYLYAKNQGGDFILRFEDTDKKRSEKKYEKDILNSLHWLGIQPDRIFYQSKRTKVYKEYINFLITSGDAYISKEKAKEGDGEVEIVRFKNTYGKVSFEDELRGTIETDISDLGDFVIARSIDDPLYNLAVVIDDISMGITHLIRGDDLIASTPRQVAIYKALNSTPPKYIHIPLIHSATGGKLSKRKDATSISEYRNLGYLPEAIINLMALLGWNPKTNEELFSLRKLVEIFKLSGLQKQSAVFNIDKLNWFNNKYIANMSNSELSSRLKPYLRKRFPIKSFILSPDIWKDIRERATTFREVERDIMNGQYDFYYTRPKYEEKLLKKQSEVAVSHLKKIKELLSLVKVWNAENIKSSVWDYATEEGRGNVLWPFRVSLSGREKSPDPFSIAESIGKRETIKRLDIAIKYD